MTLLSIFILMLACALICGLVWAIVVGVPAYLHNEMVAAGEQDFTPCGLAERPVPVEPPVALRPVGPVRVIEKSAEQACYEAYRAEARSWRPEWHCLPLEEQMAWKHAADAVVLHAAGCMARADDLTAAGRGESVDIVALQQEAEAEEEKGIPPGTEAALYFREAEDGGGLTITAAFYPGMERGSETPAQATAIHALALLKREQMAHDDDDT